MTRPVSEVVTSILKPLGYRKSGRLYRKQSEAGDTAVVHVRSNRGSNADCYRFFLRTGLVLEPEQEWRSIAMGYRAAQHH